MYALQLPRLGQTMESGVLSRWIKFPGDAFRIGDLLYEVETEKVTIEIEAKRPGVLVRLIVQQGDEVPVGGMLAVIGEPDESPTEVQIEEFIQSMEAPSGTTEVGAVNERREATVTSDTGPIRLPRTAASPRARELAKTMGIDLADVTPGIPGDPISEQDVRAIADSRSGGWRQELTPTQRWMASTVARSWSEIPQFSQTIEVDATWLRQRISHGETSDRSITDRFVDAILAGVLAVPEVNTRFEGDHTVVHGDVNISVAVATEKGLVVPVLKGAQQLSPKERTEALLSLIRLARSDELGIDHVQGGSIALSNLGTNGIVSGVPLVMPSQTAIVFVGNISERPIAVAGEVQIRPLVYVTAAFDHRVIDGIRGAAFMAALKDELERSDENPHAKERIS